YSRLYSHSLPCGQGGIIGRCLMHPNDARHSFQEEAERSFCRPRSIVTQSSDYNATKPSPRPFPACAAFSLRQKRACRLFHKTFASLRSEVSIDRLERRVDKRVFDFIVIGGLRGVSDCVDSKTGGHRWRTKEGSSSSRAVHRSGSLSSPPLSARPSLMGGCSP